DALGIILDNRLRQTLREALRGTYGVSIDAGASKVPVPRYSVSIEFGCDPERAEELVKTVLREVEALRTTGPTEREVADAREALLRGHESDLAQNANLAGQISDRYENGEDVANFFGLPNEYRRLAAALLQETARGILDTGNYVQVILFPEK
ncbi:MAG: hypothetical protein EHM24_29900, partial [Acidobacteria bacterium]